MFNLKAKAYKKAEELRAKGYRVLTTDYRDATRLVAEKDDIRHLAQYRGRKLQHLETTKKHQWHDVISYQPISSEQYLKDFK